MEGGGGAAGRDRARADREQHPTMIASTHSRAAETIRCRLYKLKLRIGASSELRFVPGHSEPSQSSLKLRLQYRPLDRQHHARKSSQSAYSSATAVFARATSIKLGIRSNASAILRFGNESLPHSPSNHLGTLAAKQTLSLCHSDQSSNLREEAAPAAVLAFAFHTESDWKTLTFPFRSCAHRFPLCSTNIR